MVRAALADPLAFTRLYDRYLEPIYSYCYVRLNSREAAEDATSEVFLKAFTGLSSYRGGLFVAWLFRIAHNVVINLQTRQSTHASFEMSELADPGPTMEEMIISASERQEVRAALAQLPAEQRTVLELQCAGWSGAQIAATLGKSNTAIRMLRHRPPLCQRTAVAWLGHFRGHHWHREDSATRYLWHRGRDQWASGSI